MIVSEAKTKINKMNIMMVHAIGTVSKADTDNGLMAQLTDSVIAKLTKMATEEGYDAIGLRTSQKQGLSGLYESYVVAMKKFAGNWDAEAFWDYSKNNLKQTKTYIPDNI